MLKGLNIIKDSYILKPLIYKDNKGAKDLANNPSFHKNSKHILQV